VLQRAIGASVAVQDTSACLERSAEVSRERIAVVSGWFIPPPSQPVKSDEDLRREREAKVGELGRLGLLRSERLGAAMLTVRREDFIPTGYRDYAYEEIPLPLPGERATISCPHSYPLFYEPLRLGEGHRFLEVGVGSGYGTSLARELVGPDGLVVAIDIDATTLAFARKNLERAATPTWSSFTATGDRDTRSTPLRRDLHHCGLPRFATKRDQGRATLRASLDGQLLGGVELGGRRSGEFR
jgi:hypothetical protein